MIEQFFESSLSSHVLCWLALQNLLRQLDPHLVNLQNHLVLIVHIAVVDGTRAFVRSLLDLLQLRKDVVV